MTINGNAVRSVITFVGMALPVVAEFLGCKVPADAAGAATACAGSWLTPGTATIAGFALVGLAWLTKAFGGTGTVMQNLFSPAVPVVPEHLAGPGTVTPAQVAEK